MTNPILVVLGGLPGTGKTSIARELCSELNAVHLRIDTIEQELLREDGLKKGYEGYFVAYALAKDNLSLGNIVIADSVNPISITREAWRDVAAYTEAKLFEIEIICSDKTEHKHRVETRKADIKDHKLPTWDEVSNREYQPWLSKTLTIDTYKQSISDAVKEIIKVIDASN